MEGFSATTDPDPAAAFSFVSRQMDATRQNLIDTLKDVYARPTDRTGTNILRITTTEGVWKVRQQQKPNGTWTTMVWSPRESAKPMYSLKSALRVVNEMACDVVGQQTVSATTIQAYARKYLFLSHMKQYHDVQSHVTMLTKQLEERQLEGDVLFLGLVANLKSMRSVLHRLDVLCDEYPQFSSLMSPTLNCHFPETLDRTLLLTEETNFSRLQLKACAEERIRRLTREDNLIEYQCCKAVLKEQHFPVLLGRLPLPTSKVRKLDNGIVVQPTGRKVSKPHLAALQEHFNESWSTHVCDHLVRDRTIALDVYHNNAYCGSMIITKFLEKIWRDVSVLSIESIVCKTSTTARAPSCLICANRSCGPTCSIRPKVPSYNA